MQMSWYLFQQSIHFYRYILQCGKITFMEAIKIVLGNLKRRHLCVVTFIGHVVNHFDESAEGAE